MKRGDYLIHVFIEQARQLHCPQDRTVDPMIECEVLGEKKYTSIKNDITGGTTVCSWNEHIFFEPRNLSVEQVEHAKISIRVMDHGFFKDSLIGCYDFDVSYIYFMKNHTLEHRWIALSNPQSSSYDRLCGYLKVSIAVTTKGDDPVQLIEEALDIDQNEQGIMMPPQLKPSYQQITIRIFCAEHLPMLDNAAMGFGKANSIDAYISCNYQNYKLRTQVVTAKRNEVISWYQEFLIPVTYPIMSGRIVLKVMDEDIGKKDEVVGSLVFNITDFIGESERNGMMFWKNIYGAHIGYSGANTDQMNENPEVASAWKGRVLVQVLAHITEKPICIKRAADKAEAMKAAEYAKNPSKFDIIAEVCQGISLPKENEQYNVMIKIADYQVKTEKQMLVQGTYNRWTCRFNQSTLVAPYKSVKDIGRIFVYLMQGDKAIAYWKGDASEFEMKEDPSKQEIPIGQIRWVELMIDPSVGVLSKTQQAGLVAFKISIRKRKEGEDTFDFSQFPSWKSPPPIRPVVLKVRAYIFQCRDLPTADDDSQSDPYVKIWSQLTGGPGVKTKTSTIDDNNNPIFYEFLDVPAVEAYTGEVDSPPFVLDIYDSDKFSDDFIGRSVIYLDQASIGRDIKIPKPKWHPVRIQPGAPQQGEILVSFTVVDSEFIFQSTKKKIFQEPITNMVETEEFQVDINILGLRNLQSVGIMPVKKAYVSFDLKSLVSPDQGEALENIKTQPGPTGPNPTINSTMNFRVALPKDELYCPKLVVSVYDYQYKGMKNSMIGSFNIPVGDLIREQKQEQEKELEHLKEALQELDKIIREESVPVYRQQTSNVVFSESKNALIPAVTSSVRNKVKKELLKIQEEEELKAPLLEDYDKVGEIQASINDLELGQPIVRQNTQNPFFTQEEEKAISQMEDLKNFEKKRAAARQSIIDKPDDKKLLPNPFAILVKDKFNDFDKQKLVKQHLEDLERVTRIEEEQRQRDLMEFKDAANGKVYKNILYPCFSFDQRLKVFREVNLPPLTLYMPLGWDEFPNDASQKQIAMQQGNNDFTTIRGNVLTKKGQFMTYAKNAQAVNQSGLDTRRHYRRFYVQELENVKEIMAKPSPFNTYHIMRGRSRGFQNPFWKFTKNKQDEAGQISTECVVGEFKGIIQVQSVAQLENYKMEKTELITMLVEKLKILAQKEKLQIPFPNQDNLSDKIIELLGTSEGRQKFELHSERLGITHLRLSEHIRDLYSEDILKKLLLSQQKCIIRVNIISAFNLSQRDFASASDPYLILTCGNNVVNEKKDYQLDNPNPDFYKTYEFEGTFPGCPLLSIKLMDYDDILGDDLIGETKIDLEDRFFSPEWQSIREKPIEYRDLYHPSSSISQGTVKMWLEIIPATVGMKDQTIFDIKPKPVEGYEVRVAVFDTRDLSMMDVEGTSDVYVKVFFDPQHAKETDTHYRCTNGKASFNYRILFDVNHPTKDPNGYRLNFQVFDRDFFKSNDVLGDAFLDLRPLMEDVILTKRPLTLNKIYYDGHYKEKTGLAVEYKNDSSFWLNINTIDSKTGQLVTRGQLRVEVTVIPKDLADKNKVGEARQEPNHSPFLPPPVGRLNLTWNPFKMLNQFVGPAFARKIYLYCILFCCLALIIAMLPMILSNMIANLFTWN